ncbi:3'-5' RNA helicase ythdc2 [Rhizophlyctis rosea]|nr:3'-5' RNA helicase ythdc2 [Rhizophlyctis rosea]
MDEDLTALFKNNFYIPASTLPGIFSETYGYTLSAETYKGYDAPVVKDEIGKFTGYRLIIIGSASSADLRNLQRETQYAKSKEDLRKALYALIRVDSGDNVEVKIDDFATLFHRIYNIGLKEIKLQDVDKEYNTVKNLLLGIAPEKFVVEKTRIRIRDTVYQPLPAGGQGGGQTGQTASDAGSSSGIDELIEDAKRRASLSRAWSEDVEVVVDSGAASDSIRDRSAARQPIPSPSSSVSNHASPPNPSRYFVVRASDPGHIHQSRRTNLWSIPVQLRERFSNAYNVPSKVVLIFTCEGEQRFFGYANMTSDVHPVSIRAGTERDAFSFVVEWVRMASLAFNRTGSILDAYNNNQPVRFSTDGREVHPDAGERLCRLIDENGEEVVQSEIPTTTTTTTATQQSTPSQPLPAGTFPLRPSPRYVLVLTTASRIDESRQTNTWSIPSYYMNNFSQVYSASGNVVLMFGVTDKSRFYGYAQMTSPPVAQPGKNSANVRYATFSVEWANTTQMNFSRANNIGDDNNGGEQVWRSKNAEEVHPEAGGRLCRLLDEVGELQSRWVLCGESSFRLVRAGKGKLSRMERTERGRERRRRRRSRSRSLSSSSSRSTSRSRSQSPKWGRSSPTRRRPTPPRLSPSHRHNKNPSPISRSSSSFSSESPLPRRASRAGGGMYAWGVRGGGGADGQSPVVTKGMSGWGYRGGGEEGWREGGKWKEKEKVMPPSGGRDCYRPDRRSETSRPGRRERGGDGNDDRRGRKYRGSSATFPIELGSSSRSRSRSGTPPSGRERVWGGGGRDRSRSPRRVNVPPHETTSTSPPKRRERESRWGREDRPLRDDGYEDRWDVGRRTGEGEWSPVKGDVGHERGDSRDLEGMVPPGRVGMMRGGESDLGRGLNGMVHPDRVGMMRDGEGGDGEAMDVDIVEEIRERSGDSMGAVGESQMEVEEPKATEVGTKENNATFTPFSLRMKTKTLTRKPLEPEVQPQPAPIQLDEPEVQSVPQPTPSRPPPSVFTPSGSDPALLSIPSPPDSDEVYTHIALPLFQLHQYALDTRAGTVGVSSFGGCEDVRRAVLRGVVDGWGAGEVFGDVGFFGGWGGFVGGWGL